MVADGALAVAIEGGRVPHRAPVGQRAKAGVEMVEPVFDQLDRDNEAIQNLSDDLVRANIRAETVAAK